MRSFLLQDGGDDAFGGVAVPQFRTLRGAFGAEDFTVGCADLLHVVADEHRGSAVLAECHRAIGVPAERQAWRAENAALLLQPAGIRQHDPGAHVEPEHVVIAKRIQKNDLLPHLFPQAEEFQLFFRAGMDRPQ